MSFPRWGTGRDDCNLAKVGVEGSNPFARSRHPPTKLAPPIPGPQKSPTAGVIRATGLGVRFRNDTANLSLNAVLSPRLGAWPIYSIYKLFSVRFQRPSLIA
jgi:hypothetical protein